MAEDEGLAAALKRSDDLAQPGLPTDPPDERIDIGLAIELEAELRANLGEHFAVDLARPLIDDEVGDVVLPQFAGDLAEDRLAGKALIDELVCLFDDDDEAVRFLRGFAASAIHGTPVGLPDAP